MKTIRLLLRLALLLLVATAFAVLSSMYARVVPSPSPRQKGRPHRSLAPKITEVPEFLGEGVLIALCTVAGRVVFRLRLSRPSPRRGQPISLSLRQ